MNAKAEVLFEVSWEVCNKVGGIFTVVQSKVLPMKEHYGDGYFLVGPYFPKKCWGIFEEHLPPDKLKPALELLKKQGIEVHYGIWLTKGNPVVLLVDFINFSSNKDDIKRKLWDWFKIDSLLTEWFDFDEPVVWAFAVGRLIEELSKAFSGKIVAHFHEWLAGAGLLYLKRNKLDIGTVFTTHATTLGRSLAMQEKNLYEGLESINPDSEAKSIGVSVWAKHLLEKQSALNADVFTTVSEITGIEAEYFLARKPDVLLFNGLDLSKFPSFEEASVKHKQLKARIHQFLMYYFFPYYSFDLGRTLIFFIAGRYEFHDKGVDVFIKALGRLDKQLKKEGCDKTIVAFFWIPGNVKAINPELLESRQYFEDIKGSVNDVREDVHNRLLYSLIAGKPLSADALFGDDFLQELKPKLKHLSGQGLPHLSTHILYDEEKDVILNAFKQEGLNNSADNIVKVVFYPIYLSGADGLLDMSYYESMQGSHLGVFPSYYEPWGYTPLEAAALGVSSLTTDLSGFGQYICKECIQGKYPGIFVLPRFKKSDEEIVSALTEMMSQFAHFTAKERVENKIVAQKFASSADWKLFIERYIDAHNRAVDRI